MAAPLTRKEWTGADEVFLKEHYAAKGGRWCAEQLGRTHASVLKRAEKFDLHREGYRPRGSAAVPPLLDEAIRSAYRGKHRSGAIKRLAQVYGVSRQSISKRALQIGARKFGRVDLWSAREVELLQAYAQATPYQMARILKEHGFTRTAHAVDCARREHNIDRAASEFHQLADVARLLGVSASTPRRWIRRGLLTPEPGTDTHPEENAALISDLELARFLTQHTTAYSLGNLVPNHEWFIDLLVRKGALAAMSRPKNQREAILQAARAHPTMSRRQIADLLEMDAKTVTVTMSQLKAEGMLTDAREAA